MVDKTDEWVDSKPEDLWEDSSVEALFEDGERTAPPETGGTPPGLEGDRTTGLSPRDKPFKDGDEDTIIRGLAQGVTQGWADETTGAIEAGVDVLRGKAGITEIGEAYVKHRNESRSAYKEAEKRSGGLYTAMDIAGSIGTMFTPVGAGVKLSATLMQGAAAGIGYGESDNPSDTMTLEETLTAGAKGAAFGAVGHGAGALLGKAATGIKKLSAGTVAEALGVEGIYNKIRLGKMLRKQGRSIEDWSDNIYRMKGKDGKSLFESGQTITDTLEKTESIKSDLGVKIGGILSDVDEVIGKKLSGRKYHGHVMDEYVNPLLNSGDKASVQIGEKLKNWTDYAFKKEVTETIVEDGVEKVTVKHDFIEDISLKGLHDLKNAISKRHSTKEGVKVMDDSIAQNVGMYERNIRDYISSEIDDIVATSSLSKKDTKLFSRFKAVNRDYGDVKEVVAALRKKSDEVNAGGLKQILKNALQTRGLLVGAIASSGIGAAPAMAVAVGINQFLSHPAAPATLAVGMKKVSHWLGKHPEKYAPLAQRILAGAGGSHAALDQGIAYAHSYIDLDTNPLPRKTADLISRQNELLTVLDGMGYESQRNALRSALDSNDKTKIANIAEQLGSDPKLSGFFKEGLGFDGQANTEESKAAVNSWVQGLPTLKERMMKGRQFQQSNQIPEEFYTGATAPAKRRTVYQKVQDKLNNPRY